jgi:hypothetical protein
MKAARNRWSVLVVVSIVLVIFICYYVWTWFLSGPYYTRRLLEGATDVRIRSFRLTYQLRGVNCSDTEVLDYLAAQFRAREDPSYGAMGGTTYELQIDYEGAGTDSVISFWNRDGAKLAVCTDGEQITDSVPFRLPRPPQVEQILDFLMAPNSEVKGQVLIVDQNGVRRSTSAM